jgi:hypothetical protein
MMWQPIETAPKDGTQILCCWAGSPEMDCLRWIASREAWCVHSGGWGEARYRDDEAPTHWMPLPEVPRVAE